MKKLMYVFIANAGIRRPHASVALRTMHTLSCRSTVEHNEKRRAIEVVPSG